MAKRAAKMTRRAVEGETEPESAPVQEPAHDPAVHVKLGGKYVEHEGAANHERRISHKGKNYEHVGEDEDGVWTYRQM